MLKKDYTSYSRNIKKNENENTASNDNTAKVYGLAKDRLNVFMLDVRQKNGDKIALPYSYLTAIYIYGAAEIRLHFTGCTVILRGRNLDHLYASLLNHRVEYVKEEDLRYDEGEESDPFIQEIVVE